MKHNRPESAVEVAALFQPEEVSFSGLPRRALVVWRISMAAGTALWATGIAGIAGLLIPFYWPAVPSWPAWTVAGALVVWAMYRWRRLHAVWSRSGYCLAPEELWVRGGAWHRYLSMLPYGRIQLVDVQSGPVQRRCGLASVVVGTGAYHMLAVHDVDAGEAEKIRDWLTRVVHEKEVAL